MPGCWAGASGCTWGSSGGHSTHLGGGGGELGWGCRAWGGGAQEPMDVPAGEVFDYLVSHGRMKEKEARAKFRQVGGTGEGGAAPGGVGRGWGQRQGGWHGTGDMVGAWGGVGGRGAVVGWGWGHRGGHGMGLETWQGAGTGQGDVVVWCWGHCSIAGGSAMGDGWHVVATRGQDRSPPGRQLQHRSGWDKRLGVGGVVWDTALVAVGTAGAGDTLLMLALSPDRLGRALLPPEKHRPPGPQGGTQLPRGVPCWGWHQAGCHGVPRGGTAPYRALPRVPVPHGVRGTVPVSVSPCPMRCPSRCPRPGVSVPDTVPVPVSPSRHPRA